MIVRGATDRNVGAVLMVMLPAFFEIYWLSIAALIFGWPVLVFDWLCEQHGDHLGVRLGIAVTAIWWGWLIYCWAS